MKWYKLGYCVIIFILLVLGTGFLPNKLVYAMSDNIIITLTYQGKDYIYNFEENLPNINNFWESKKLQKNNRLSNLKLRADTIQKIIKIGYTPMKAFEYMLFGFEDFYNKVRLDIECEVKDAEIIFDVNAENKFIIKEEKFGYKLNENEILREIWESMYKNNVINVQIKPEITIPKFTKKELSTWTRKLSTFSTNYSTSTENRKHNVRVALSKFDGMRIKPNETVSFNTVTGRRTMQNGYREAKIIQDREYIEAYGGGVCQSSTTLYNALLLAGVEIKEVHSHSLAPNYIELGFDAMVNYGTSDLKFCNASDTPIFVHTKYTDQNVIVEIYGKPKDNYIRKRVSEIVEKISPEQEKVIIDTEQEYLDKVLYEDEEWYKVYPKAGYKARGYIEYYDGDKLLNKKKIREVKYHAVCGVKIKGAKEREIMAKNEENLFKWNTLDKLLA